MPNKPAGRTISTAAINTKISVLASGGKNTAPSAVMSALANPAVRQRLETLGQVIFPRDQQTPAGLAAYHKAEIDKWWPIIKAAGIKAD